MKSSLRLLAIAAAIAVCFASSAFATTVEFGDSVIFWPGWGVNSDDIGYGDVIGDPNITGGSAVIVNGKLMSITINYYTPYNDWRMLAPGDLFINLISSSDDTTWDYVAHSLLNDLSNPYNRPSKNGGIVAVGQNTINVYDISSLLLNAVLNDPNYDPKNPNLTGSYLYYILSGKDDVGIWSGYDMRDGQPVGVDFGSLSPFTTARFTGFPTQITMTADGHMMSSSTWTFGDGLDLNGLDFIIGFGTTCGNDVIYERIDTPVPEPSTLLLLGLGLAGLGMAGRRLRKK